MKWQSFDIIKKFLKHLDRNENVLLNFNAEFRLRTAFVYTISEFIIMLSVTGLLFLVKGPVVASGTAVLVVFSLVSVLLCIKRRPVAAVSLLVFPTFAVSVITPYFALHTQHFVFVLFSSSIILLSVIIPAGIIIGKQWSVVMSAAAVSHIIIISFKAGFHNEYYFTTMPLVIQAFILAGIFIYYVSMQHQRMAEIIISHNRQLEEKVELRTKELLNAEKMASIGSMVAGAAHEINTPLGVSITAVSHLRELIKKAASSFRQNSMTKNELEIFFRYSDESADIILGNLNRAGEFINSFKKLAVDQITEARQIFNLSEYISNIIASLNPVLKKRYIHICLECPPDIVLDSFPGMFSQIFTNLIINSLHHGFSEYEQGDILIECIVDNQGLCIIYSDNGSGISSDVIGKIFDPFFTTKRGKGGAGLGLNIVYNIITQRLMGKIECRSSEGDGCSFQIKFPLAIVRDRI